MVGGGAVKSIAQAAQVIILVALILAAGLMMSGVLVMPEDPETRTVVMSIGAILVAILDPRGLRKEMSDETDDTGNSPPVV